jgi:hypothetical protein
MNTKKSLLALAAALGVVVTTFAQAPKVDFPAASPACTLKQRVGLTDIEIVYSRPCVKGRKIFGGLLPYGEVWRTGANNATKIIFSTPVKINGAEIPAGTYALFTIPGEEEWTIIINKGSAQWGAYKYSDKDDVVRVKAKPAKLPFHVESFLIDINGISDESATMYLAWEHELTSTLVPQIEAVMASDEKNKPYFQSATFYYEHGQDLKKASEWVDAAIKQREWHNVVHLKAKILAKLGDKEGALVAAKRSLEMATKAKDAGYVKMNEDLIASLK